MSWISMDDARPEVGQRVVFIFNRATTNYRAVHVGVYQGAGEGFSEEPKPSGNWSDFWVTHWLPVPEMPK